MRIVLLEDDWFQADSIRAKLEQAFPKCVVEQIPTEHEFRSRFPEMERSPPDIVILDVMVRWADPQPEMPLPPPEVESAGQYRAGLRCHGLLRRAAATSKFQ